MKSGGHNNDKGEHKIRTINSAKKLNEGQCGEIVREISKGPVEGIHEACPAPYGTLYDGPLSKPAHYVGLKDRTIPDIKMPRAKICCRFMDVEGLLDAAEGNTIMSSGEVVSFSEVNIAKMMKGF